MNHAFFNQTSATEIIAVDFKTKTNQSIPLLIKRDDLIDPLVSGNKWRKLKFNIAHAIENNMTGIASFGGAFSNHIFALAAAGNKAGLKTLGFIRTHQLDFDNPTLKFAQARGMELVALSKAEYRLRHNTAFLHDLKQTYPDFFFVPEGGSNELAFKGLEELAKEIKSQSESFECTFQHIACAFGSGGTLKGLSTYLPGYKHIGISVVKDEPLFSSVEQFSQQNHNNIRLHHDAWFGGYGRFDSTLAEFCLDFWQQTGVPIEPVYTGKLFYALCYQREALNLAPDEVVLAIHTGGLQGIAGQLYRKQLNNEHWQSILDSHVTVNT